MKLEYKYNYTFTFIIGNDELDFLNYLSSQSKFTFAIFTEYCSHGIFNNWVKKDKKGEEKNNATEYSRI